VIRISDFPDLKNIQLKDQRNLIGADISENSASTFQIKELSVHPEDGSSMFLRNVGTCLPNYIVTHTSNHYIHIHFYEIIQFRKF
jgi:hypothetical protein